MVYLDLPGEGGAVKRLAGALKEKGILCVELSGSFRFVYHKDVDPGPAKESVSRIREALLESLGIQG